MSALIHEVDHMTAVSLQGAVSGFHAVEWTPCFLCDICRAIHDLVMKIIKSICDCFSAGNSSISATTTSMLSGVSVADPLNLIAFYRGQEANNNGVTLDQILGWDDANLEAMHNYIQWLFPLQTPSGPNPTAARLDQATMQTFQSDPVLKNQVLRSLRRMLSFYGLQMDEATRVMTRAPNFAARSAVWLSPHNHNFLRISRMIQSLHLLGLSDYSRSFYHIMENIYRHEGSGVIGDATFGYWRGACPGAASGSTG